MTNRTPTEVISAVEQWASHIITQPNDPMRRDVAAVLAMARQWAYEKDKIEAAIEGDGERMVTAETARIRNMTLLDSALSAAGVGGGE